MKLGLRETEIAVVKVRAGRGWKRKDTGVDQRADRKKEDKPVHDARPWNSTVQIDIWHRIGGDVLCQGGRDLPASTPCRYHTGSFPLSFFRRRATSKATGGHARCDHSMGRWMIAPLHEGLTHYE
jgi:hypothetical protein